MPELPEVEVLSKSLKPLIGKEVFFVFRSQFKFRKNSTLEFKLLNGKELLAIERKNKFILFYFDNLCLIIHLGMTGQILINETNDDKHTHLILKFDDIKFSYRDVRRFGIIDLIKSEDVPNSIHFKNIGFDLTKEIVSVDTLLNLFRSKKNLNKEIKPIIMDNQFICGIGNIYASEILFRSKIHPTRKINSITNEEFLLLFEQIKDVLNFAISVGGSSISDYKHSDGSRGDMQKFHLVYNKKDLKCSCGNIIKSLKQKGRTTYFCDSCQK